MIYKRGKYWQVSFVYQGRRYRKSTGTGDRKLAQKICDSIKGKVVEGKWFPELPSENKTFKDLVEKFEFYIPPRSHSTYQSYIKDFQKFFGDRLLSSITPKLVDEYRQSKGGVFHVRLVVLKRMLNIAVELGWFEVNPLAKLKDNEKQNIRVRWMSDEEERKILSNLPEWFKEIVIFALNTGMRIGEIVNLTWKDVDLFRKTITVLKTKSNKPRTIPINSKLYEILLRKSKVRSIVSDKVFSFTKAQIQNFWVATCKGLKIENLHFHDLRHTFATRLAQQGVDPYRIQLLLGHSTPTMTQRYAHHNVESLRSAVELAQN